jgi:hypothetical protein
MSVVEKVFIKLSCRCGYRSVISILEYDRKFPITCARCGNVELTIIGMTVTGVKRSDSDKEKVEGDKHKEWEKKYNSVRKHI